MSKADAKTFVAFCPACDTRIRFDEKPELYDIVTCPECEGVFEVVGLSPIQLDWLSDFAGDDEWSDEDEWSEDDDWDDDDEWSDDDDDVSFDD